MNSYEYRDNLGNPRDYYDIVNDATKLCEEIEEKNKAIERLNNIIDELEKYIKEMPNNEYFGYLKQDLLDKLKVLKEGK